MGFANWALLAIASIIAALIWAELRYQKIASQRRPSRNPFDHPRRTIERDYRAAGE